MLERLEPLLTRLDLSRRGLGLFLVTAMALSWPMILAPGAAALGSPNADGMKHLWTLWWIRTAVRVEGQLPLHTKLVNWPEGLDLYPIEPLGGLFAVLLPWLSLVALSNLLVLLNVWATGVVGAWFGRQVSGRATGGLAAGLLLQGSAVMAFFVHAGVGELLYLWLLPLGLGLLVRARRASRAQDWALLALALAGSVVAGFYLGLFLAVAVSIWALATLDAGRQTPALLLRYAATALVALLLVWPVIALFSGTWRGSAPEVGWVEWLFGAHGQAVTDAPSTRLALLDLVWPRGAETRQELGYGGGRYLGWLALALAGSGLARRRREALPWVAVAAVGLVLALGSALSGRAGEWTVGDGPLYLPFFWFNRLLAYVAEPVNFPVRFLAVTAVGLAALASLSPWRRAPVWAALAGLEVALVSGWPWPSFAPLDASALTTVAEHRGHAMVDLALVWRPDAENRWGALSSQIVHGHPIQAVPIERIEYFARDGHRFAASLPLVQDLEPFYNRQVGAFQPQRYRRDVALLREAGFEELLVHYRGGRERLPDGLVAALTALCGPPVARGGAVALWKLPEANATDSELATWKREHKLAISALIEPGQGPMP